MSWRIYTADTPLHTNTVLCLVETTHDLHQKDVLPESGTAVPMARLDSSETVTVVRASAEELLLKLSDESQWRLTPWNSRDPKPLIGSRDGCEQNWVVRSAA